MEPCAGIMTKIVSNIHEKLLYIAVAGIIFSDFLSRSIKPTL